MARSWVPGISSRENGTRIYPERRTQTSSPFFFYIIAIKRPSPYFQRKVVKLVRKTTRLLLTFVLIFALAVPAAAAESTVEDTTELSFSTQCRIGSEYHTLADIAAIRLACYGIAGEEYLTPGDDIDEALTRPEAIQLLYNTFAQEGDEYTAAPFTDVDEAHRDCVDWAYANNIARGCSATTFGTGEISEAEFVTLLLRALGLGEQFAWNEATTYAAEQGLRPLGLSNGFTLGDAMLYLQEAISIYDIPHEVTQEVLFPRYINACPKSVEEIDAYLHEAADCLADRIYFYMSDDFDKDDFSNAFAIYNDYYTQFKEHDYRDDLWFYQILDTSPSAFRVEYIDRCFLIRFIYSDSWDITRDREDDAFTRYEDDTVAALAEEVYQQYLKRIPKNATDKQKVQTAMQFICDTADYDWAVLRAIEQEDWGFRCNAHSILGYLENKRIVCDGYSDMLQYLLTREGIPCLVVNGATTRDAEYSTHSWNKVKLDGKWLNVDVCWKDTAHTTRYDFKSDEQYTRLEHFPHIFGGGVFG